MRLPQTARALPRQCCQNGTVADFSTLVAPKVTGVPDFRAAAGAFSSQKVLRGTRRDTRFDS